MEDRGFGSLECVHGIRRRQQEIDFARAEIIESLTNEQIDHLRRREREAAETQAAILRALVRQLLSNRGSDFSEDEAAREVGVSTRKVLSHFPSRERMSEGVLQWVRQITDAVPLPSTPADLQRVVTASHRMFEKHRELIRSLLFSARGRSIRARLLPRRRQGIARALEPLVAQCPPGTGAPIQALIACLASAETWWQLRDGLTADREDVTQAVTWVIGLLSEAAARGDLPVKRPAASRSVPAAGAAQHFRFDRHYGRPRASEQSTRPSLPTTPPGVRMQ